MKTCDNTYMNTEKAPIRRIVNASRSIYRYSDTFTQGIEAYYNGLSESDCPYNENEISVNALSFIAWSNGYAAAKSYDCSYSIG